MTNEEIDEILTAYAACKFEHRCAECPMSKIAQYGDCSDILDNKVMEALKRLKYLENPKNSEAPKDEPDPLYIYEIYGAAKAGFYVIFPEITDPGFDTKIHTIRANELEFKEFILEPKNVHSVRAYSSLRTKIHSLQQFVSIEKERYMIIHAIGPKVFDYICKKYDEARKFLDLEPKEIDIEKLKLVKLGKTKWTYDERFLFSKTMNSIFS